jgi:hypothetical protein
MTDKFKDIIDNSYSTLDDIKDDYKLIAKKLEVDITHFYSQKLIEDEVIKKIKIDFDKTGDTTNSSISVKKLNNISQNLVYRFLLFDEQIFKYLNILQTLFAIKESSIKRIPSFEDSESWKRIISNVKDFKLISKNSYDLSRETLQENYPQEYDRVVNIKTLISEGCKVSIEKDNIEVLDIELAISKLENLIKKIGGVTLARSIFNKLSLNNYSEYFERFHLTRQGNGLPMQKSSQIPIGYLLNLCVKYPYEFQTKKNINKELLQIQNLSTAIVTGKYDVQHYSQWTQIFQTGETIIKFCTEIALWDSMYSLIQIRPSLSFEILEDLYKDINEDTFFQVIGICKNDYFSIIKEVFDLAKYTKGIKYIYISSIVKKNKTIDKQHIKKVLDINSHIEQANSKYIIPSDITSVDFQFNSLIKLGETKYLLMDKSWCAVSLFESLATQFRIAKTKNFDSNIGYALEKLIYKYLEKNNVTYFHGNYTVDSIYGECDLLIETTEAIILIEFKKKVLTRKAKSGIDIDILIDLSDSLLSSQLQAGRTEIILREKGEIILTDTKTNSSKTIEWKNRRIERISLTQLDFGGFQDKTIIHSFFNALLTHTYGTHSEEKHHLQKFDMLKEKQKVWSEQFAKLNEIDKNFAHFPFFDCNFMNLGQLLEIINLSTDNDSFFEKLKSNKFVTFGTLDFYREFEMKNNLNEKASR